MKKLFVCLMATILPIMCFSAVENVNNGSEMKNSTIKKTRSVDYILDKDKEWEPAGEGVTRKIMGYDGQVMLVKVKFEKGAVGTPHAHYHTQTTYVASGKFEFDIEGKKKIVSAGDGIYIEPDALHGCVCLEPGILIDCFSPMRADFLK